MKLLNIFFLILLINTFSVAAEIKGTASLQSFIDLEDPGSSCIRLRYVPEYYGFVLPDLDTQISLEMDASGSSFEEFAEDFETDFYRLWIRYAEVNWEIRGGLQKINFGAARVLRSLNWFESADARDPLKAAGGVKGVLGRCYFRNNANIWLWGLWGNKKRKGLEIFRTEKDSVEGGGRFQYPVPYGEAAFSYHCRLLSEGNIYSGPGRENRFGLDCNFDIGPGLWFETTFSGVDFPGFNVWNKYFTIGADYTFPMGSGILVTSEYFISAAGEEPADFENTSSIFSLSGDKSISMIDRLNVYALYYPDFEKFTAYFLITRTYDNFKFDLGVSAGEAPVKDIYGNNSMILTATCSY